MVAAFLDGEDEEPGVWLAIASIAVFAGPAPCYDEFAAALASRLPLIPGTGRRYARCPSTWARRWSSRSVPARCWMAPEMRAAMYS